MITSAGRTILQGELSCIDDVEDEADDASRPRFFGGMRRKSAIDVESAGDVDATVAVYYVVLMYVWERWQQRVQEVMSGHLNIFKCAQLNNKSIRDQTLYCKAVEWSYSSKLVCKDFSSTYGLEE